LSTPARRISPWWWVAGGCAAVLVLTIAAGVVVAILGSHALLARFEAGGFSCLPSDFPNYPGAKLADQQYDLNANTTPVSFCQMTYRTGDSTDSAQTFYLDRLNTGPWDVTSGTGTQIVFEATRNHRRHGTVDVTAKDGYTQITIDYYSP
jgi:hypothetical protein